MEETTPQETANTKIGYGKRPLWQWIILYVIIGAIVYGLIYYFVLAKKGGYSNNAPSSLYNTSPSPAPSQTMSNKMTVALKAENNSQESGTATIKETDGKLTVMLTLTGYPTDNNPQPAHIHTGACPGVGAVKYPLADAVNGTSITVLPITLDELKKGLPLAINVHKSKTDIATYVSCGELSSQ